MLKDYLEKLRKKRKSRSAKKLQLKWLPGWQQVRLWA